MELCFGHVLLPAVLAEDGAAEAKVVCPAEEGVLEALVRSPTLGAVKSSEKRRVRQCVAEEMRQDALEAALHQVDNLEELAVLVPGRDVFFRSRDRPVGVRRVLNDDGRIERFDERVQVGVRRRVVLADVGLEGAVCNKRTASGF